MGYFKLVYCSLLFAELIYESYSNGMLQVCMPELVDAILGNVAAAYGGSCPRKRSLEGAGARPNVTPVVHNKGPENLHMGPEGYGKGYVVEHAKSWR